MEKTCDACGASRFRLSRFRLSDFRDYLLFVYPVRCLECQERSYASVSWALQVPAAEARKAQMTVRDAMPLNI